MQVVPIVQVVRRAHHERIYSQLLCSVQYVSGYPPFQKFQSPSCSHRPVPLAQPKQEMSKTLAEFHIACAANRQNKCGKIKSRCTGCGCAGCQSGCTSSFLVSSFSDPQTKNQGASQI